jgi:hypothetical protein
MTQATTPRWYCVDKHGMTTPCNDKQDAEQEAQSANRHHPSNAPHRAVQLVEYVEPAKPTVPTNSQEWAGMDGGIAYHLIERHADNWADVGKMMGEWLAANQQGAQPTTEPDAPLSKMDIADAIKTLCVIGDLPDYFDDVADWIVKGEIPTLVQEPVATLWQNGETGRTRITMTGYITDCDARWFKAADLYTTPPAYTAPAVPVLPVDELALKVGMKWHGLSGFWEARHYQLNAFAASIKSDAHGITAQSAAETKPATVQDGWQTIKTAPKDGRWIIVCDSRGDVRPDYWLGSEICQWAKEPHTAINIYWMPLPAAPKEGGEA